MNTGFMSPESFIHLDAKGYIHDRNGIPALYHIIRDFPKQRIDHEPCYGLRCPLRPDKRKAAHIAYWWKRVDDSFGQYIRRKRCFYTNSLFVHYKLLPVILCRFDFKCIFWVNALF